MINNLKELYVNLMFMLVGFLQNLDLKTKIIVWGYRGLFIIDCVLYLITLGFVETTILLRLVKDSKVPIVKFNPIKNIRGRVHAMLYTLGILLESILFIFSFTLLDTKVISNSISEFKL